MLRFGAIVGPSLRAWELECVRELEASGLAQLACIVRHRGVRGRAGVSREYDRLAELSGAQTQGRYDWLELARTTDSIVTVDAKTSQRQWQRDVASRNLDFLLLFGPEAIGAALRESARLGVWAFAHGDHARFACAAPGFWEIYRGCELTAGFLVRRTSSECPGIALKSVHLATIRNSFRKNADSICSLMAKLPALVCRNIEDGVAEYFSDEPMAPAPEYYGWPNAAQTAAVRLLQAQTRTREYLRSRLFSIDWNVGLLNQSPSDFIGKDVRPRASYLFRGNPYDYIADPCLVTRGSRTYLFCERYDHRRRRGVLVQTELSGNKAAPPSLAIEEEHHLSYPYVFEHDGETYCIPESGAVRKVCLYRCVEFPQRWEYVRTLIDDFDGADSTLVSHAGKWWLFCTSSRLVERGFNSHLYVWYADDLFGQWKPHVRNPVKMDARSARCAGPAFLHENALYRPVQDCGSSYGGSIHIARIDVLTERDFHETLVGTIRPPYGRYAKGVHTICAADGVCVIDARRYVFSPWRIAFALRRLLRRMGLTKSVAYVQPRDNAESVAL